MTPSQVKGSSAPSAADLHQQIMSLGCPKFAPDAGSPAIAAFQQGFREARHAAAELARAAATQGAPTPAQPDLLRRAYDCGWVRCSEWAHRDDLVADCDSRAYTTDRDNALSKLAAGIQPTPEQGEAKCQ